MVERWVEWAVTEVDQWPDDVRKAPPNFATLEAMAERSEDYLRRNQP